MHSGRAAPDAALLGTARRGFQVETPRGWAGPVGSSRVRRQFGSIRAARWRALSRAAHAAGHRRGMYASAEWNMRFRSCESKDGAGTAAPRTHATLAPQAGSRKMMRGAKELPVPPDAIAVAVPMPAERVAALDALAESRRTDRTTLVNEAVAQYLADQAGWASHLDEGLRQADAGEFAGDTAVAAAFAPRAQPA